MASLYFDSIHHSMIITLFVLTLTTTTMIGGSSAQYLSPTYYSKTCPGALAAIRAQVQLALAREKRLGASIVRLFFHDCFVLGCDGSLLLDDTPTFRGEKTARPNNNSVRGFEVIDQIKAKVESLCPGVVSCADIVAVAARDSVVLLGGPNWDVKLGRRDSRTASFTIADTGALPGPQSNLSNLFTRFRNVGLSPKDMVALSGAHTIGLARCVSFRPHIYNDTNIDSTFAKRRQAICPRTVGVGDNNLASLDFQTPSSFDNRYFQHLVVKKGLLHSDQVLYDGGSTDSLVINYSKNQNIFFSDFVQAMIKMGDNNPLLTPKGEIRKNCRRIN